MDGAKAVVGRFRRSHLTINGSTLLVLDPVLSFDVALGVVAVAGELGSVIDNLHKVSYTY